MKPTITYHNRNEDTWVTLSGAGRHGDNFMGNFGFIKPYRDFELIRLDEFDIKYYADVIGKLKNGERIFRYETDTTRIGGMRPLVKVNADRGLVYFNDVEPDEDALRFETRGHKVEWLHLIEN